MQIDVKLAALEARFGKKPNFIYILACLLEQGSPSSDGRSEVTAGYAERLQ